MTVDPPRWTREQLERDRQISIANFRRDRLQEPIESFTAATDEYQGRVWDLLEATVDLTYLIDLDRLGDEELFDIVTEQMHVLRYIAGPPISEDDLKVLAEVESLAPARLRNRDLLTKVVGVVLEAVDRRRFPWISEDREPNEHEKNAAALASACLMAYQRVQTDRRNDGKKEQEAAVENALLSINFTQMQMPRRAGAGKKRGAPQRTNAIRLLEDAPTAGHYCGETMFGGRKADFIVGLFDQRRMPIECKVSNSQINSIKRLNNDAAVKAKVWVETFGTAGVVPAAVLSGVFGLPHLEEAQDRGLTLFWAHDLQRLTQWIESTRVE